MAITWDVKITNVNVQSKRADVIATRTDSASALPPQVYSMQNTPIGTAAERLLVLNTIKEWTTAARTKVDAANAVVLTMEQDAKVNLEAWELTR